VNPVFLGQKKGDTFKVGISRLGQKFEEFVRAGKLNHYEIRMKFHIVG
jgi:hypothetical protein